MGQGNVFNCFEKQKERGWELGSGRWWLGSESVA